MYSARGTVDDDEDDGDTCTRVTCCRFFRAISHYYYYSVHLMQIETFTSSVATNAIFFLHSSKVNLLQNDDIQGVLILLVLILGPRTLNINWVRNRSKPFSEELDQT